MHAPIRVTHWYHNGFVRENCDMILSVVFFYVLDRYKYQAEYMSASVCRITGNGQSETELMDALGVLRRNGFHIGITVIPPRPGNSYYDYIYFCQHDKDGVDRSSLSKMLEDVLGPINEHGKCAKNNLSCRLG